MAKQDDSALNVRKGPALWWWMGTIALTAATIAFFHNWSKPYLNVESEGKIQVPLGMTWEAAGIVSAERLRDTIGFLSSQGTRLSGSKGAEVSADYLAGELRKILGPGSVTEETFEIDNPFDLGTEMETGGHRFRIHPLWAPVVNSYELPPEGKSLGTANKISLANILKGDQTLSGTAAVIPLIQDNDLRLLVIAAAQRGFFKRALRDPLTRAEKALLERAASLKGLAEEDNRILDVLAYKHQKLLADFLFDCLRRCGIRSVLFLEPGNLPKPFRVSPRSFDDRILKHTNALPRYIVSASDVGKLRQGAEIRVHQAPTSLTFEKSGEKMRMEPIWPNLVRTCTTPRSGLTGKLVWAGRAAINELNGKVFNGSIAMVDFNSGYQWIGLADLGVKAVIFVEPNNIMRGESENKYLSLPADIPRFWVSREQGRKLRDREGETVRIDSQVVWERRKVRTVIGRLPGTFVPPQNAPSAALEVYRQPVVIQSFYDSVSVVPGVAPGAEQACGAAATLELARVLKRYPLRKTVLFVINPGHCQNMAGWSEFLHRHYISLEKKKEGKKDPDYIKPAFIVHLDMTTQTRRLGMFHKAHKFDHTGSSLQRIYASFGKAHAKMGQDAATELGYGEDFVVDAINAISGRSWDSYIPGRFTLAQEITVNAGLYGIAYATPDDERALVDTPHDTLDKVDFESLLRQTRVLASIFPNVLNVAAAFSSARVKAFWTNLKGRVVEFDPRVSYLPDRTVSGAMVWIHTWVPNKSLKGVRGDWFIQAISPNDQGGALFEMHGGANSSWLASGWKAHLICEAYEMDPLDGSIRYAPDRGPQGSQAYALETEMNEPEKELMLVTFPCRSFLIFDLIDPLRYGTFSWMTTLDARTDSPPPAYGQSLPEPSWYVPYVEPLAVSYVREDMRAKFTFAVAMLGKRGVLINATKKEPEGIGYAIGEMDRLTFSNLHIARDMHILNDFRLKKLRRHGIINHYLEDIHGQTSGHLESAESALKRLDYREAIAEARAAWALAARVYPDVEKMALDVVKSAMLYLALLIPFAFLAERLLLAFPIVTQQVGAVLGIFLAMFLALRAVHPAFQVALTPIMILLAFILIVLSLIVSGMVVGRFFNFLKQQREASHGVHEAEVSQTSVGMAAFSIGVSNMRKRSLRTALTCATLVALTFAVLSLTSVLNAVKQRKYTIGKPAPYEGLLFRTTNWSPLTEPALKNLETELGAGKPVPRSWFVSYEPDRQFAVEIVNGDKASATALAALGLTDKEVGVSGIAKTLTAGEWFKPGETRACILPAKLAATLYIGPEDVGKAKVKIFGVDFTVRGLFDPLAVGKIRDLDDEEITPVNFEATQKRLQAQNKRPPVEGLLPQRYDHHDAAQVVIMTHDDLMRLGGRIATIAVPMKKAADLKKAVTGLLSRLGLLVYVGLDKKTYAYSAIGGTTLAGMDFLLVPVLIAALIVFSTMLGSVQERKREIGIFSSVGLAPNHVAILFLAEACVYAILGAVIGYLLGQSFSHLIVSGKVLPGLNVNYSSNAAILAVVIVMVVVLLSTLYPARLASHLARPSQVAGFTLPSLVADTVKLDLPFSFNERDAQAVCAFLAEYFDAHAEASAGGFSAGMISLGRREFQRKSFWELSARVWLAPYDFGVSQDLTFQIQEGEGSESSASLAITRLSGDQSSWHRVNTRFLKGIRKQLLIWRSQGEKPKVGYHRQAQRMSSRQNKENQGKEAEVART